MKHKKIIDTFEMYHPPLAHLAARRLLNSNVSDASRLAPPSIDAVCACESSPVINADASATMEDGSLQARLQIA
jgi:hypothetical protein